MPRERVKERQPAGGNQTYGAFPAQVAEQTLVLLRRQQDGAHVHGPPGRRVVVHGASKSHSFNPETTQLPRDGRDERHRLERIHAGSGRRGLQPDHLRGVSRPEGGGGRPGVRTRSR